MFKGYLKYMWIGLYLFMLIYPYLQIGIKGFYFGVFMSLCISILLLLFYFQEKESEKNHEEKPAEENKYTMGNFAYDVKKFVEMFNSSEKTSDFKKAKVFLDIILEKEDTLPLMNRFFSGYLWGVRQQMLYLQAMMRNYEESPWLKLSDLTRIKTFVREYNETIVGFGLNSFDSEYHYDMRSRMKGLSGYKRTNKIRLLNASRAYQKRLGR